MPISTQTSRGSSPRVLIIGLDGATFQVITPLIARGHLPHLDRLLSRGASGTLLSTDPYVTGPAWTSLVTGKRPDTHGILDWSTWLPGTYRRRLVDARDRSDLALWEILHRHGLPAGTVNLPVTYPPSRQTSFCVTGLLTPAGAEDRYHPPSLRATLEKMGYVDDVVPSHYRGRGFPAFLDALIRMTHARGRAIRHCLARFAWHAAVVVFVGPDRIQHAFWHHLDPTPPIRNETQGAIAYFQILDEEIGRIVKQVPEDTHIYIVSDHGFGPHRKAFHVNDWLEANGFLRRKREHAAGMRLRRLIRAAQRRDFLPRATSALVPSSPAMLHRIEHLTARLNRLAGETFGPIEPRIDWSRTVAFAPTPHGIQINLKGREPRGIVSPEAYPRLRETIRQRLAGVRDPETGALLHAEVLFREEKYDGKRRAAAPDLTYRFLTPDTSWRIGSRRPGYPNALDTFVDTALAAETGTHTPEGILIATGPDIAPGHLAEPLHIWDVLPTVLYHLGLPIPEDLDGHVATRLIRVDVLASRPITRGPAAVEADDDAPHDPGRRDEDSVRRRLEDLGYLA